MNKRQSGPCVFCRKQATEAKHYVPLDKTHEYPLCAPCLTEVALFDHAIDTIRRQGRQAEQSWQAATTLLQRVRTQHNPEALGLLQQILTVYAVHL